MALMLTVGVLSPALQLDAYAKTATKKTKKVNVGGVVFKLPKKYTCHQETTEPPSIQDRLCKETHYDRKRLFTKRDANFHTRCIAIYAAIFLFYGRSDHGRTAWGKKCCCGRNCRKARIYLCFCHWCDQYHHRNHDLAVYRQS